MKKPAGIELDRPPLRAQNEVEFRPIAVRSLLNANRNRALPFRWTINPYRGCEFGCGYCYARYTHSYLGHDDPLEFERRIYLKLDAAHVLRETLRPDLLAGQPVAMGTATDPYQSAERHFGITRAILEVLLDVPELELAITTKSPLVLRDLDLLKRLAARDALTVNVTITTLNQSLARILERGAPTPRRRLDTIAALADAGIPTAVFVMPILPGITDRADDLARLLRAAKQAGARIACGNTLHLESAPRRVFLPLLARHFPDLHTSYLRWYRDSNLAPNEVRSSIDERFRILRETIGLEARGRRARPATVQLSLDFAV